MDVDDVYDKELQDSLKSLQNASTAAATLKMLDDEKLMTVLNLAGTLKVPISLVGSLWILIEHKKLLNKFYNDF